MRQFFLKYPRLLGADKILYAPRRESRPHGIRHASITEVLNLTHGDMRAAQRFSRHKNINMLAIYDDNREDLGSAAAKLIANILTP